MATPRQLLRIEGALPGHAEALTALAHRAKAHWGYPPDWMEGWATQLTLTPEYLRDHPAGIALNAEDGIVGFYALRRERDTAWIDHLWVDPPAMRSGIGRALFRHAEHVAKASGCSQLKIESDPHAEGFYRRMGAITIEYRRADIGDHRRLLPILEKSV